MKGVNFERHFGFERAKCFILVQIKVYFICALCLLQKNEDGGILEYMRPRKKMTIHMTMCCGSLVCRACYERNVKTRCHVCSKDTNVGWQTKRGSRWKIRYLKHVEIHRMWQVKPFLGPFCSKFFNGLWEDIVKIIQGGNQEQIEALEKQYFRFVCEIIKKQYLFFTFLASFNLPFDRQPSQMQGWYSVLKDTRQYTIRRRTLLKMFQNGFVKMLANKFSQEKELTKMVVEIKFRRNFFLRILRRILSKRNQ
jgi:hypothetical protein